MILSFRMFPYPDGVSEADAALAGGHVAGEEVGELFDASPA